VSITLLNFSHPLTSEQIAQIEAITGDRVQQVIGVICQADNGQPLAPQVAALADSCGLSAEQWQTLPLLVNPPSLNFIAVALLAELHGRCGYFPAHLRLRPIAGSVPTRYEVAEVLDLQGLRECARRRRQAPSER
jgi:hypothetical protein